MIKDDAKASGRLVVTLVGPEGKVKESHEFTNLVVTSGLDFIASRMAGETDAVMSHMAVGTDGTAAALGQTTLVTELARVALTSTTVVGSTISYVASYPAGTGTGAIVEAGIFNDVAVGTMLSRTVFPVINKGALDTMTISWTITVS